MKIGIGVTTTDSRRGHYGLFCEQIMKHTENKYDPPAIMVTSSNNKGIAHGKNECLRELMKHGCDMFFLFDDDCFPIADGWADFFIDAGTDSGQKHFMYLKPTGSIIEMGEILKSPLLSADNKNFDDPVIPTRTGIIAYNNCAGCMIMVTRRIVETVGGFNEDFGLYGYEHADYSQRIHRAGFTPLGQYTCPAGAGQYIYSLDLDNHMDFGIKHKPSLPIDTTMKALEHSRRVYESANRPQYIPL